MAMASRVVAFIVLLLSLDVVSGQHSPPPNLEIYPGCAIDCITAAFEGGVCAPTDQTCTCTDEKFQSNVTDCVTTNCTIIDALATKNITSTGCGDPIRDRSRELVTITVAMGITAAIFVILRFSCKMFVVKVKFGMDDWFVLASAVATTPSIFINVFGTTANGLGRDIWTLQPDDITSAIRYFWAVIVLYFLETALTKLSIICFYIQIFPSTKVLRVLWATFAVTSAWGVAFVLAAIFQCQPTSHFWNHWDGLHEGHCADPSAIGWSNAAMNIAFDLWILAIPLSQLRKLQLHWKKKVGVVIMFCLGTFVTIVSILRLQSLATFTSTTNITWNFYELSRWSTVEICLGIVCACLPTVRLLCVRMFPVLGGSLHRRTSSYHFQANTARGLRSHAVGLFALDSSESDQEGIAEPGPAYHKEHTLHFSQHEDTNAICIHGLDASGRIRLYHNLR